MSALPIWLQAAGAAIAAAFAWLWWGRRKATQRAEAAERRAELGEAERDAARGEAIGAAKTAEYTADQLEADREGTSAGGTIHAVTITGDAVADVRAVDAAARELSAARREGAADRDGRAPAVPRRGR